MPVRPEHPPIISLPNLAAAHEPVDESLRRLPPRVGDCDPHDGGSPSVVPAPVRPRPALHALRSVRVYDDEAEYRAAYIARLDRHGDDVIAEINDITDGEGGTLLCYCRLDLARSFCHRLFLAQWIETRHGLYVPQAVTSEC